MNRGPRFLQFALTMKKQKGTKQQQRHEEEENLRIEAETADASEEYRLNHLQQEEEWLCVAAVVTKSATSKSEEEECVGRERERERGTVTMHYSCTGICT